jgi:hypothetical protein
MDKEVQRRNGERSKRWMRKKDRGERGIEQKAGWIRKEREGREKGERIEQKAGWIKKEGEGREGRERGIQQN